MKRKRICFGLLIMLIIAVFAGCQQNVGSVYTVWTDVGNYSDIESELKKAGMDIDIKDGYYIRGELPNDAFNAMVINIPNECMHIWTENEIKKWFIGRGFGETESTRETAWLITVNHGMIMSRTANVVYAIVK